MSKSGISVVVKWKDVEELSWIPSRIAREKCPKLVIDYYEERIVLG